VQREVAGKLPFLGLCGAPFVRLLNRQIDLPRVNRWAELDRFCRAMNLIFEEYEKVKAGVWPADDNPLHNAPHTNDAVLGDSSSWGYSGKEAACPDPEVDNRTKYWPPVAWTTYSAI
jgi:hypothetical protein